MTECNAHGKDSESIRLCARCTPDTPMQACRHNTQRRIGLTYKWCILCGAINTDGDVWTLPVNAPRK